MGCNDTRRTVLARPIHGLLNAKVNIGYDLSSVAGKGKRRWEKTMLCAEISDQLW